ncbi:MAG TPA: HD domain-containing protein [Actinomycetota bacterium]
MEPIAIVERLRLDLDSLDRAYSAGHHGLWSAAKRTEIFDAALISMFHPPASGVALVALGGYGRGQQLPRSDLDLLLVHDGSDPVGVSEVAERVLYPLWDAGFEVGHALRTPIECALIAREHVDACTAMLDLRFLAGDTHVSEEAAARVRSLVTDDPAAFTRTLDSDGRERADRVGSAAHRSEPDLKSGAGGLRDIQAIGWLETAWSERDDAGWALRSHDRDALADAEEFLTRARSALQLETGRRSDRLPLDMQPSIARAMGFSDEPGLLAEDGLMRAVFEHARTVRWITARVFGDAMAEGPPGSTVDPLHDAAELLEALAVTAERGERPSVALLDAIEAAPVDDPVRWAPPIREGFLRVLRAGEHGVDALDALDRMELLTRFLPAWSEVRCRPQRDPYHRLTVDAHLTTALAGMGRMLAGSETDDPVEREMVKQVDDIDGLLLGALLHDIGKTGEGSHVPIGTEIATEALIDMGIEERSRELAIFMVRYHLVLPDTATRRDLTDENLILDVAAKVGSPDRLAALYLLAKADALATGPAAWTSWRQTLVRELVGRVQRAFERGDMGTELAERLTDGIVQIRDRLSNEPDDSVERFVLRMPRAYFLAVEPEAAARHFATISPALGSLDVRTSSAEGVRPGTYELLVVASDRPGLLSWIAGSLALAGLSILTAQVFTTDDGAAVDLFEVEGVFEREVDEARWREFRRTLRKAVEGRTSLSHRVVEKRRLYPGPAVASPVTVRVDNQASEFSSVIEVGAPDRLGLLYDITSALADLRLDVHLAKVTTYTDRVIDAFYVRDALGGKVTNPDQIQEIETAVRARCAD